MYAPLLSNRYLTSKLIPLTAVAAVAMCVALVIIVVSVMTGFLDMVRTSGKTLIGDVVLSRDITGVPYYAELVGEIEALPEAEAACAVVETYGLLQMPYGTSDGGSRIETVQVWGIEPAAFDRVTGHGAKLYWRKPSADEARALAPDDPRLDPEYQREAEGMAMRTASGEPGLVLGIEISPFNRRTGDGTYRTLDPFGQQDPGYFMPNSTGARLTLVPVSSSGSLAGEKKRQFAIVNEFESGVYQIDAQRVLAPLDAVQEMLLLDEAPLVSRTEFDENGRPKTIGISPARATTILVRAAEGVAPVRLREAVEAAYDRFAERVAADPERSATMPGAVTVATWEERLSDLIGPVEKERELMRTLFSIVYVVCAILVLAIFWAIVQEKTRDIGILRAIGASRAGILWIFLRYGLLIGTVGSALGVLGAWATVSRINDIHALLGSPAPLWAKLLAWAVALGALVLAVRGALRASALQFVVFLYLAAGLALAAAALLLHQGFLIWDPSVYYFSRIPSRLDLTTAAITAVGGVVFSVVGASIPAARAADTEVVQSLRYE
ncbi:MAG: Lipoprotein-releasing system transrane protein LolE [Planctomycetota bacterium]